MTSHGAGDKAVSTGLVVRLRAVAPGVLMPRYASCGSAGADVHAWLDQALQIKPGERALIPTGLHVEIPFGYEIQVRSRSGLAAKHGIFVINSPGTIDSDFRGEIKILIGNIGSEAITISPGERIAQLIVAPVLQADFHFVDNLDDTDRGHGGFGSTGL